MPPIVDTLKELGSSGTAGEVADRVIERLKISEKAQEATTSNGQSRVRNQIGWARFYLVKAGLVDASQRGVWTLTEVTGRARRWRHRRTRRPRDQSPRHVARLRGVFPWELLSAGPCKVAPTMWTALNKLLAVLGLILTTGGFTSEARKEATRDGVPPIELVDSEKLISMFARAELGLRPIQTYELEDHFFDEFRK